MTFFNWHIRKLQDEAEATLKKYGDTKVETYERYIALFEYRRGLLKAIEILKSGPKSDDDDRGDTE